MNSKRMVEPSEELIKTTAAMAGFEKEMFEVLLNMLNVPACHDGLKCPKWIKFVKSKVETEEQSLVLRCRQVFARCMRMLDKDERVLVRTFLFDSLWQLYVATLPTRSDLLRQLLDDEYDSPENHPLFIKWCGGGSGIRLDSSRLFLKFVDVYECVSSNGFVEMWKALSVTAQGKIRATMWSIITCAANVHPYNDGKRNGFKVEATGIKTIIYASV